MQIDDFLSRWRHADGSELANYQLFVGDLCALLGVEQRQPAREDTRDNAYVFERRVTFRHGDGSTSAGRIDCYRRSAFVLEAKKIKAVAAGKGFDDARLRARGQAESYARALPAEEGLGHLHPPVHAPSHPRGAALPTLPHSAVSTSP